MLRILNGVETQHDWRLVVLAACVCSLTSIAAANLFQRARVSEGHARISWLFAAGLGDALYRVAGLRPRLFDQL